MTDGLDPDRDREQLLEGALWREWCARLSALGERILGSDFPGEERGRAEGVRALTRKIVYALQMEVEAGDPDHPTFVRLQDPYNQWGGPNPDNVYLRAAIDPNATYRVWGEVGGVRQAIFSLHEGDMQLGEFGVWGECSLRDLHSPDGRLELTISPHEHAGNWIRSDPRARLLTIRIYQSDWERDAVPPFHIVRAEREGLPRPPIDAAHLARALDRAATWVEKSTEFWNAYTRGAAERTAPNTVVAAANAAGGAADIAYGSCIWQLAPDEALLITGDVPDADYWGFALHTLAWLESGDFADRQVSLNHLQAHVDGDGKVRIAVAHDDPGVANWIDSEGRERGMLVYRWVWARTCPVPSAAVVPLADVAAHFPADHPRLDAAARRASLARRREAAWRRYL